jgi:hypothetical protein
VEIWIDRANFELVTTLDDRRLDCLIDKLMERTGLFALL